MSRDTKYKSGDLRQLVAIQDGNERQSDDGQVVRTWASVSGSSNLPAMVRPLQGSEGFRHTQVDATLTHKVVIRNSTEAKVERRFLWGSRVLNIRSSFDPDNYGQWTECICAESV